MIDTKQTNNIKYTPVTVVDSYVQHLPGEQTKARHKVVEYSTFCGIGKMRGSCHRYAGLSHLAIYCTNKRGPIIDGQTRKQ